MTQTAPVLSLLRPLGLAALVALLPACATLGPQASISLSDSHVEPDLVSVKHVVEKGQTVYRIAKSYGLSVEELIAANNLDATGELKVGQELWVPGAAKQAKVAQYDSPEPEATATARRGPTGSEKRPGQTRAVKVGKQEGVLQWPVRGVLYAKFGRKGKEGHDGIDLAAPAGSVVKTAGAGTVLFAGDQRGYGLIVLVEHDSHLITLYAHNRDLRVKTGQKVREGQVVATVGDSGKTSGPHLHFEVRKDGVPTDPLDFLGPVPPAEQ